MAVVEYVEYKASETAERPIHIYLNNEPVAVSQGSPYGLGELAIGYLLSEGLLADRNSFIQVQTNPDNAEVYVSSREGIEKGYTPLHRVTSAGCAQSALLKEAARIPQLQKLDADVVFQADNILKCMDELCELSPRRNTGECVHGCGIAAQADDELLLVREDIGRHNAMDKLIGQAWLDRVEVADKALFITGRISAEMALKAYRGGVPVLVSRKSATDEAIRRAMALGLTLVSHCREGSLRVLSHPQRVTA